MRGALAGHTVFLVETEDHLLVFDTRGTQIMQYRWPKPGVNTSAPAAPGVDDRKRSSVTDVLMREVSPMS
jgi:hypothetical protein